MSGLRYAQVFTTDWVIPVRSNKRGGPDKRSQRGHRMACCDCGLVHIMNFRVRKGRVEFQAIRERRATAALRRRSGVKLRKRK